MITQMLAGFVFVINLISSGGEPHLVGLLTDRKFAARSGVISRRCSVGDSILLAAGRAAPLGSLARRPDYRRLRSASGTLTRPEIYR